jgi:hypothetical protein
MPASNGDPITRAGNRSARGTDGAARATADRGSVGEGEVIPARRQADIVEDQAEIIGWPRNSTIPAST